MKRLLRTALAVLLLETALLSAGVSNARQCQFREEFVQYSFRLVRAVKAIDGISLSEDGRHVRIVASPAWELLTEREQRNITRNVRLELERLRRMFSLTGPLTSAETDRPGRLEVRHAHPPQGARPLGPAECGWLRRWLETCSGGVLPCPPVAESVHRLLTFRSQGDVALAHQLREAN